MSKIKAKSSGISEIQRDFAFFHESCFFLSMGRALNDFFGIQRSFLIYNLVRRNIKLKYRRSYAGLLWTVLIPGFQAVVYFVVFQYVIRVQVDHYLLFLLSGLLPWTFFSAALMSGTESILYNHHILDKVPIPAHSFPLAEVYTAALNFVLALPVLAVVAIGYRVPLKPEILLFPVYFLFLVCQAYGFSLICAYLFVRYRDVRHILNIVLQAWFYATPVLYTSSMLPEQIKPYLALNPVGYVFVGFRAALLSSETIDWMGFSVSAFWAFFLLAAGFVFYRRWNPIVVENV